jgi:hypothetical protein
MNQPINERIAEDMLATLQTIKRAGGYANDLAPRRPEANETIGPKGKENSTYLLGDNAQRLPTASHDQTGREEDFLVVVYVNADASLQRPIDTALNSVAADVEKALTFEPTSRKRGGLAFSTEWISTLKSSRTPIPGVLMRFRVRYFTQFNNPLKSAYSNIP